MFGFFSMSASKVAAVVSSVLSKFFIMKVSANEYNKEKNNVFVDESNNYFGPITANGNSTQGSVTPYGNDWSWYFDGSGDYLSLSDSSDWDFGTDDFTFECWVYTTTALSNGMVLIDTRTASNNGYIILTSATNAIVLSNAANTVVTSTATLSTGIWNHVCVVKNGSSVTIYINGVASGSVSYSTAINASGLRIGSKLWSSSGVGDFNGYISNLRLVKGTAVYTSNFTPTTSPLSVVSGTVLLTCQNSYLIDNSSKQYTITSVGDTQSRHLSPYDIDPSLEITKLPTESVYFDGSGDYLSVPSNAAFSPGIGDFTWEAYIFPTSWASTNHAVYATTVIGGLFIGKIGSNFSVRAYGVDDQLTYSTLPTLNVWTHVAVARNGTKLKLYYNGVEVASTTNSYNFVQGAIRIASDDGSATYTGYISNLRLVKGTAVYTTNFTPSTSPLTAIANTSLLTCQGAAIADNSTNNFTITTVGDARIAANSPFSLTTTTVTPVTTTPNWSVFFDGAGDALSIPASTDLAPLTGDFTYECWVYPTSSALSYRMIFGIDNYAAGQPFRVYQYGTNFQFWYTASAGNFINSNTISINQWYHLAITRSGTSVRFFVNGTQVGSTLTSSANYPSSIFRIGMDSGSLYPFVGYISNLRVNKGTAVYTSNFTPSTSALTTISGTALLTCNGERIIDSSSNNFAITTIGNSRVDTFSPFITTTSSNVAQSWSGFFDGSGDSLTTPVNSGFQLNSVNFTIECWVYVTSAGNNTILSLGTGGSALFLIIEINSTNQIKFVTGTGAWLQTNIYTTTSTVPLNTWAHIAVVRSATSTLNIYINGVSIYSTTSFNGGSGTVSGTLFIGTYYNNYNNDGSWFRGYINNLRIVRDTAVYTENFTPSTSNLTAISGTSLLTCNGPRFIDGGANGLPITTTGDAKTAMFGPSLTTGSMFFNGSSYLRVPNSASLNMDASDFTIECWYYPTAIPGAGGGSLFAKRAVPQNYTAVLIQFVSNLTPQLYVSTTGSSWGISNPTASVSCNLNSWNHVAVTRSANTYRLFINGQISVTATLSGSLMTNNDAFTIGASSTSAEGIIASSYISNFRIVKGTAVYTSAFTPPTADLTNIANTSLLILGENNFNDFSSNNFAVTNVGAAIHTNNNGLPLSPYASNYGVQFSGSNWITVNNSADLEMGSSDFTIECWVYLRATPGANGATLFNKRANTSTYAGFALSINSSLVPILIATVNGSSWGINATGTVSCSINSWTHVAVTRVGTTFRVFINGEISLTATLAGSITSSSAALSIGASSADGGFPITSSYMTDFRIVKGTALYTTRFTPPTAKLSAVTGTTLLTLQNNRLLDNSTSAQVVGSTSGVSIINSFTPYNNLYSWYFDGTGDYVAVNHSNATNILSGDFTIECWFNSEAVSGTRLLMGQWQQTAGAGGWGLSLDTNNILGVSFGAITEASNSITSSVAARNGTWNHAAVTRNGSTFTLWLNGIPVGTTSSANTRTYVAVNTTFGMYYNSSATVPATGVAYYKGWISNARIVKGVSLYNNAFTPSIAPLITTQNTGLLTAQSNSLVDNSGNSLNITGFGDTRVDSFTPFSNTASVTTTTASGTLLGGTAYFDGTGDYLSIPANDAFVPQANEDFTIEFWWRPTTIVTGGVITSGWNNGNWVPWVFYLNSSNSRLEFYASSNGSSWDVASALTVVSGPKVNQWYHIAISRRTGSIRAFVNGILSATVTSSLGLFRTTLYPVTVGAGAGGVLPTAGYISNLRISRGAGLYVNNFAPPTTPVTTLASTSLLLNFRNAGVYDGLGNTIFETLGDAATSTVQKKNGTTSLYFDGTGDYISAINPLLAWGTGDFTIECWVNSANVSGAAQRGFLQTSTTVGGLAQSYSTGIAIVMGTARTGTTTSTAMTGALCVSVAGEWVGSTTSVMSADTWTHVAVVRNSGVTTLYVNGTSVDSRIANGSIIGTNIAIGGYYGASWLYVGYLDDLNIYSYAKYTSNFTPT